MSNPAISENNEMILKAEDTHHDVGIVGLWFGLNYGSILTYYALYDVVKSMGYSAIMVNKPEVLWRPRYAEKDTVANKFIYRYCDNNVTQCYHSSMDYKFLNKNCDTFIVGSDVVWHYQICGREAGQFFFLDFVNDDKKKIAMASSFGSGYEGPEEDRMWSEHFMKKFDYIGVREDEAVAICQDTFHCHADKIMDPVFLCKRQVYHDLAAQSSVHEDKKYISSYFLGPGEIKAQLFLKIAEILGCEYRCLPNPNNPENFTKKTGLPAIENPSVEDWLKYFQNTECYVGDSFHGLCFSIIFGRPFVCIVNQGQSLARFRTLLATVGLENRMINIDAEDISPEVIEKRIRDILAQEIDYEKVWAIIDEKAKVSYDWLKNAIESDKKVPDEEPTPTVRNKKMGDLTPDTVAGVPENVCTGCSACMNVCPVDAITMEENEDGFIMPHINEEKCIHCKKCITTCPAVNTALDNALQPEIYAAMAQNEIRSQSSSGGMFTVLAEKILEMGGYVCGAALDSENLQIVHRIVHDTENLAALRKAKYAQSNINLLYRDIKKLLQEDNIVLFTGTPCQVAGLKAFLHKRYDNLYVVDILCHGVPSQKLLRDYLDEIAMLPEVCGDNSEPPKPTNIIFRDKERHGWRSSTFIRIEFDNGAVYEGNLKENDTFEKIFHEKLALRKSCADCLFCAFPRQGDLSIGDFWGIQEIEPGMTDKLGTSLIFINNSQGRQLYDSIKSRLFRRKAVKISTKDIKKNRVRALYPANAARNRFMLLRRQQHSLSDSVQMALNKQYDVGLCVNYYAINFGGALTHYALYHVLEDMGYSTLMIERPKTAKNIDKVKESYPKVHIAPLYPPYAVAPTYQDREEMRRVLNNKCNMFMVGSDKLFNFVLYTALDKYTSLDWVSDTKKKIAYSASFGRTIGNPKIHSELAFYLNRFDHFSCREDSGVTTAQEVYGMKKPEWVLDPVFLCDFKHFQTLIDRSERTTPEKYVSSYILDPTEDKATILRTFKEEIGGDCEVFSEYLRPDSYYAPLGDLYKGPLKTEERLQSIANCDFFVTDSFHGMCFAILMRKPFVAIVNERRGAARFYSIAKMLHLEDRLLNDISELNEERFRQPIDFDAVHKTIAAERERCMTWLKNALAAPKIAAMTEYDLMRELLAEQEKKINNLKDLILSITSNISDDIAEKTDIIDYFQTLKSKTAGNLIVIAVKDTPGLALNSFVAEALRSMGLKTNLEGQHGHSYVAAINGGKVIFEQLGAEESPVIYDTKVGPHTVHAESRVYHNGNLAVININGKDYAVNSRGLNIVIYDKTKRKPIDSVCFDTHISDFTCFR